MTKPHPSRRTLTFGTLGLGLAGTTLAVALSDLPSAPRSREPARTSMEAKPPLSGPEKPDPSPVERPAEPPASPSEPSVDPVEGPSGPPLAVQLARPRTESEVQVDLLDRAQSHLLAGDLNAALFDLRGHLFDHPRTFDLLLRVGRLARQVGQDPLAEVALHQAAMEDPTQPSPHVELARLWLGRGRSALAESAADAALSRDPESAEAYNLKGRAALMASQWERAEFALRQAVQLAPTQGLYFNNLGLLHVLRGQGEPAARALVSAIERLGPETPAFVFNNLGLAYELQGRNPLALGAFEDALRTDPGYVKAQVNLSRVAEALRRRDEPAPVASNETEGGSSEASSPAPSTRETDDVAPAAQVP